MKKLICSASTKEELEKMINAYYYSKNYIITDDMKIYNTKTEKYIDNIVCVSRGRWRFEMNN